MEQNGAGAGAGDATVPWEELLGSNNWSGLLSPIPPELRDHLIRCGSFCQIAEDSFISDGQSNYIGNCRYSRASILKQVFFKETADYVVDVVPNIDGYLYTTSTITLPTDPPVPLAQTNWMGYVAVSSDDLYAKNGRRDIYVAWRGTSRLLELFEDFNAVPVPFPDNNGDAKIMEGWRDIYTTPNTNANIPSAQDLLKAVIKEYLSKYQYENPSIICVGHSLGGVLAILSAFDIANSGLSKINGEDIQVSAVAFDAPKVGNQAFNDALKNLPNTNVLRINNANDIVPYWPFGDDYVKTGTIFPIDSEKSAYLKSKGEYQGDPLLGKISQWHSLQVILHTVTGWSSTKDDFDNNSELVKARLPLVNRIAGHLTKVDNEVIGHHVNVIEGWWVEKNKGMVYNEEEDKWEEKPVPWN
ncbi:phospholipase A1-II 5-like [Curcuma longa]|uniref:phospholipase A1-II 5-like n=1 Tax=Curcuma longa TaxID=136217 RepID=UPI003D9F2FB5